MTHINLRYYLFRGKGCTLALSYVHGPICLYSTSQDARSDKRDGCRLAHHHLQCARTSFVGNKLEKLDSYRQKNILLDIYHQQILL